ncbi:MAG: hypothetical protein BWZ03_00538 [bacterium ADurb.BinA186]|nr:MAG: hypothetical protein BWZ03_00538 [bacterium ADurb.BinA186]
MLNNIKDGELVLDDQFIADYFLKDTISTIKDRVSGVLKPVKDAVSTILSPIKKIAAGVAYVANKALTAITDNDAIMTLLEVGIGVFNTLLPFGATALATASLVYPPAAAVLIPVIAAATPILQVVVTPSNVTTALKVAQATASLADQFLNKPKATTAPFNKMLALEKKAPKASKEVGQGLELTFKGGLMLQNFIKDAKKSGRWDKLSKSDQTTILKAADKANKTATLIDPEKLQ